MKSSKNKKIILILLVAVLMAVLAGAAIISYLSPHRTTIYVFKSGYPVGTQVIAEMLVPIQVDSSIVVSGRNANVSEKFITSADIRQLLASGDTLKVAVGEGMPLMKSLLSVSGGNSIIMDMAPSAVAVTVEANNITGVTSELYNGASVNIYVTSYSGGTFLLFENMRVLAVNRKSSGDLSSVTLEVTNSEAVKLINSMRNGAIQFGLINPTGYQFESGDSQILVNPDKQVTSSDVSAATEPAAETTEAEPSYDATADDIPEPVL